MTTPALPKTAFFDSLISDQNTPIARKISVLDQICDYIPVVSTITNLCNLIFKTCYEPKNSPSIEYAEYLQGKSISRCALLLIPFFGNLAIFIYDLYKSQAKSPAPAQSNAITDVSFFPPGGHGSKNEASSSSDHANAPASHHLSLNQENRSSSLLRGSKTPLYPMAPPKNYGDFSASVPNPPSSSNSSMNMSSPSLALAAGGQGPLPSNSSVSSMNSGADPFRLFSIASPLPSSHNPAMSMFPNLSPAIGGQGSLPSNSSVSSMNSGAGLRGLPPGAFPFSHNPSMNMFSNLSPAAGGRGSLPSNNPVAAGNFSANPLANPSITSANAVQVQERNDVEGQKSKPLILQASQLFVGKVEEPNNETDKKALLALVREIIQAKEDQALDPNSLPKCNLNYRMPYMLYWDTKILGTDYMENFERKRIDNIDPYPYPIDNFVGWTPLMFAVALGKNKIVDQLLEAGVDIYTETLPLNIEKGVKVPNGILARLAKGEEKPKNILYLALVHGQYELFKKLAKHESKLLKRSAPWLIYHAVEYYDSHWIRQTSINEQNLFHQKQTYSLIEWILEQEPNCLEDFRFTKNILKFAIEQSEKRWKYEFPDPTGSSRKHGYACIHDLLKRHA